VHWHEVDLTACAVREERVQPAQAYIGQRAVAAVCDSGAGRGGLNCEGLNVSLVAGGGHAGNSVCLGAEIGLVVCPGSFWRRCKRWSSLGLLRRVTPQSIGTNSKEASSPLEGQPQL